MSIDKSGVGVMDHTPLFVYRQQVRRLVSWARDSGSLRPELNRIFKQGRYAYFTNRYLAIRWDVNGLRLPDDSWVDLRLSVDDANAKPDTLTNMANWSRLVSPKASWDLMDESRWNEPDKHVPPNLTKLFRRPDPDSTVMPLVGFNPDLFSGVTLMVRPDNFAAVVLSPAAGDNPLSARNWWITSSDSRVAGLIVPMRVNSDKYRLPDVADPEVENKGADHE